MLKYYTYVQTQLAARKASKGQSLAEYGLILALVVLVAMPALNPLGQAIMTKVNEVTAGLGG